MKFLLVGVCLGKHARLAVVVNQRTAQAHIAHANFVCHVAGNAGKHNGRGPKMGAQQLCSSRSLCLAHAGTAQHHLFAAQQAAGKADAAKGGAFFCHHAGCQRGNFILHGAHQANDIHTINAPFRVPAAGNYTLNRNSMMSPSFTTYSLPSVRCRPLAFTVAMLKPHAAKSS